MVEGAALEKQCPEQSGPRVRISPPPPNYKYDPCGHILNLPGLKLNSRVAVKPTQPRVGEAIETKKCSHFFANERRNEQNECYLASFAKSYVLRAKIVVDYIKYQIYA